jgi:hypothetical protein
MVGAVLSVAFARSIKLVGECPPVWCCEPLFELGTETNSVGLSRCASGDTSDLDCCTPWFEANTCDPAANDDGGCGNTAAMFGSPAAEPPLPLLLLLIVVDASFLSAGGA